jgi:hypothetical protein
MGLCKKLKEILRLNFERSKRIFNINDAIQNLYQSALSRYFMTSLLRGIDEHLTVPSNTVLAQISMKPYTQHLLADRE